MKDIAAELIAWMDAGKPFALASLVGATGSTPRPIGTALAVDTHGAAAGGISGGCVEAAVYGRCQEVLDSGEAAIEAFGYSDDDAFAAGLTCGGEIHVLIVRVDPHDEAVRATLDAITAKAAVTLVRAVEGPELGAALAVTEGGFTGPLNARGLDLPAESGRTPRFAVEVYTPPPRLLVFGAIDFAAAVVGAAKFCGFDVTVCDARPVFATTVRFPDADEVVVAWPHEYFDQTDVDERTAVCVLTHDLKFDIPLLERALESEAGFVGAMGSRRTHRERLERLREAGVSEAALARLRSPIGIDLGGRTAEETALSIVSEIVALRNGATSGFLTTTEGPLHH